MKPAPCVVSAADHAGWANVVCVAAPDGTPTVVARPRLSLIDPGLPTMPYHHESLAMRVEEADALIERVRRSIAACTSRALRDLVSELTPTYRVVAFAIREPPFAELPDTVAAVRPSYQLQCAADGMMYQIALCRAAVDLDLDVHQCRRGKEAAWAAEKLGVDPDVVEAYVNGTGRPAGPPWTHEHRRAYAAGIAVLAAYASRRLTIRPR